MNGIIYTRVSTKEQAEERTSLLTQESECQAYARKEGVDIIEERIFREKGESAKAINRTELQNMLSYVGKHKKEVEVLYIWKIDRLARNLGDYYGIKVALAQHGVRVVSVTEPIEDDPVGRLLEAILAAAAQFDNDIRALRTVTGMRQTVQDGNWPHQAPIGYTKNKLIKDPVRGLHKALVPVEVIKKNIELIDGSKRNYVIHGDNLYPLKTILRCSNCKGKITASRPRGRGGSYPLYHCNAKTCRRAVTGRRASISVDKAHEDFRRVLEALRPLDDGIAKLYKDLVLRAWNEQYSDSAERVKQLNRQREDLEDFKQKITEKFINDKISEAERDMQLRAASEKMAFIEGDLEQARDYLEVNEELVGRAMLFVSAPDEFWNRSNTSVKQMIQSLLFPNGVIYDFETGFGTFEKLDSYLLIKKIPHQNGEEVSLVAATGNDPVTSSL